MSAKRQRGNYFKDRRARQKAEKELLKQEIATLKSRLLSTPAVFFQQVTVPEDGNCLFHSIGTFFSEDHKIVRQKIHKHLSENQEHSLQQILPRQRRAYLTNLKKLGTHGGENELIAAAQIYRFHYRIFIQTENSGYFMLAFFPTENGGTTINLLLLQHEHDEENHYVPLIQLGIGSFPKDDGMII